MAIILPKSQLLRGIKTIGGLEMAKIWAATINKHGGNAKVVYLPELGIKGNTHFPFCDLNNIQIADLMAKFLKEEKLD